MKKNTFATLRQLFMLSLNLLILKGSAHAQDFLDFQALVQETRKISRASDEMTIVWWIPEVIWQVSLSNQPMLLKPQIEDYLKLVRAHTIVAVIDGRIDASGSINFRTKSKVQNILELQDNQGTRYQPLADEAIDAATKNMLQTFEPQLIKILGIANQNLTFFLFPAKTQQGIVIADPKGQGSFSMIVGSKNFKWHLPLDSLLPEKKCLSCSSDCKGSWLYCPWCGKKLVTYIK